MTNAEKASRFDALQIAIQLELESVNRRESESRKKEGVDVLGVYNRGYADACRTFAETLQRWKTK